MAISDGDIVMTFLDSLSPLYKYFIVAKKSRSIHELTLDYVTSHLLHKLSRRKENEICGDIAALLANQSKSGASGSSTEKVCSFCGKYGYISKYCFKRKRNEESANNTKMHDKGDDCIYD
jgi:hypothetical protein